MGHDFYRGKIIQYSQPQRLKKSSCGIVNDRYNWQIEVVKKCREIEFFQ